MSSLECSPSLASWNQDKYRRPKLTLVGADGMTLQLQRPILVFLPRSSALISRYTSLPCTLLRQTHVLTILIDIIQYRTREWMEQWGLQSSSPFSMCSAHIDHRIYFIPWILVLGAPAKALYVAVAFMNPVHSPGSKLDKWKKDFEVMDNISRPKLQWWEFALRFVLKDGTTHCL